MYGYGMMGNTAMMGPFMWFVMVLLWVLVIVGVISLVKWSIARARTDPENKEDPLEILKARYAKGEITEEEFEKMKEKLALE
jgi:putative membrane protein